MMITVLIDTLVEDTPYTLWSTVKVDFDHDSFLDVLERAIRALRDPAVAADHSNHYDFPFQQAPLHSGIPMGADAMMEFINKYPTTIRFIPRATSPK